MLDGGSRHAVALPTLRAVVDGEAALTSNSACPILTKVRRLLAETSDDQGYAVPATTRRFWGPVRTLDGALA